MAPCTGVWCAGVPALHGGHARVRAPHQDPERADHGHQAGQEQPETVLESTPKYKDTDVALKIKKIN